MDMVKKQFPRLPILETFKIIREMEKANSMRIIFYSIKVDGKIIKNMEKEKNLIVIKNLFTMVILLMIKKKVMAIYILKTLLKDINIQVLLKQT